MTDTLVIIVSYNTRELTLQAVAAARKAAAGLDARVVVADNAPTVRRRPCAPPIPRSRCS